MRKIGKHFVSVLLVTALLMTGVDYTGLMVSATESVVVTEETEQGETEEIAEETEQEQSEVLEEIVDEVETESAEESEVVDSEESETVRKTEEEVEAEELGKEAIETELITTEEIDLLEDGEVLSGKCGKNLTWTLADGTLTISGTGEMYSYISGAPWGQYCKTMKKLVLSEGITSIGDNAFEGCSGFSGSLTIPDSVTRIGYLYSSRIKFTKLQSANFSP